jgi:hypothetical protein
MYLYRLCLALDRLALHDQVNTGRADGSSRGKKFTPQYIAVGTVACYYPRSFALIQHGLPPYRILMNSEIRSRTDLYFGLFRWQRMSDGQPQVCRHDDAPATIPDPHSGRQLRIATVDARARGVCPSCATTGLGGYVSFVQDLRLAYACPSCEQLIWISGA